MWSEPLDPLNPRHRTALFAAGLGLVVVMELATGWLLPALAAAHVAADRAALQEPTP